MAADEDPKPETGELDDQQRRFRAALDRKKARQSDQNDPDLHPDGTRKAGVGGKRNDHRHREFRRKSG